eukprot:362944-Chlamydomonas_euryale.AAC.6
MREPMNPRARNFQYFQQGKRGLPTAMGSCRLFLRAHTCQPQPLLRLGICAAHAAARPRSRDRTRLRAAHPRPPAAARTSLTISSTSGSGACAARARRRHGTRLASRTETDSAPRGPRSGPCLGGPLTQTARSNPGGGAATAADCHRRRLIFIHVARNRPGAERVCEGDAGEGWARGKAAGLLRSWGAHPARPDAQPTPPPRKR